MQKQAITRDVSRSINDCELSYIGRQPIDVERAREQHGAYVAALRSAGYDVVVLPEAADLPDAVFVEDTAILLDAVAVITMPGARSRRPELDSVATALASFRPVVRMQPGGTIDGGDVLHIGKSLYVGRTPRSDDAGIATLADIVAPHGYTVRPVRVDGCLHYKSGVSYIGRDTVLANPAWIDVTELDGVRVLEVDPSEPWAANTVLAGDTVLISQSCPKTADLLAAEGFDVRMLDIGEFQKAEGGLSCLSLLLD